MSAKKRLQMEKKLGKYLLPEPAVYKGAIIRLRVDGAFDVEGPSAAVIRFIEHFRAWRVRQAGKSGACKNLLMY